MSNMRIRNMFLLVTALAVMSLLACGYIESGEYYNQGIEFDNSGDHQNAIDSYTKAIESDPDFEKAYINRGIAYAKLEQYDKAINDYTKGIELNPNIDKAYYNRGIAYFMVGWNYSELKQYDKAINDFTKTIELNPNFLEAYYNRGWTYDKLGQYHKALKDYDKTILVEADGSTPNMPILYAVLKAREQLLEEHPELKP